MGKYYTENLIDCRKNPETFLDKCLGFGLVVSAPRLLFKSGFTLTSLLEIPLCSSAAGCHYACISLAGFAQCCLISLHPAAAVVLQGNKFTSRILCSVFRKIISLHKDTERLSCCTLIYESTQRALERRHLRFSRSDPDELWFQLHGYLE